MTKKLSIAEIKQKISLLPDAEFIEFEESTYVNNRTPCSFRYRGVLWSCSLANLLKGRRPKEFWREKAKESNLQKYGVEHFCQSDQAREAKRTESRKRWHALSEAQRTEKTKKLNSSVNREKSQKTMMSKTGHKTWASNPENKEKLIEFSKKTWFKTKYLTEDGSSIASLARQNNVPKISASRIARYIGAEQAEVFIRNYKPNNSGPENSLMGLVSGLGFSFHNKELTGSKIRPDFIHTEKKVLLEAHGLYRHNDAAVAKRYHIDRRIAAESEGFRILQFWCSEIYFKAAIVKSIVSAKLGLTQKIYARKTRITKDKVDFQDFFSSNHLKGDRSGRNFGLLDESNRLVCAIKVSLTRDKILKIERFANLNNTTVVGGFSKLLNFVIKELDPLEVHSWVDRRYGYGDFLKKLEFVEKKTVLSFEWTDNLATFNRKHCVADENETEREKAQRLGLFKVYDAGQTLFVLKRVKLLS